MQEEYLNKEKFNITRNKDDEDVELSISSLESFDEEKRMKVKKAMILLFLCRKRKTSKQKKFFDLSTGKYRFSVQWRDTEVDKRIKTDTLIKMMHDIRDIFNSHNEKIYYHVNDFYQFSKLANVFVKRINESGVKRSISV
jgi:hypothetical protein